MSYKRVRQRVPMGSNQSMPRTFRVAPRSLDGMIEYAGGSLAQTTVRKPAMHGLGAVVHSSAVRGLVPVPKPTIVKNRRPAPDVKRLGGGYVTLGSLGDDNTTSPSDPSIGVDPLLVQQQQLAQLKTIAAAQTEFTRRESLQRWIQIGATLSIPLAGAIWRAIFRSGGRRGSDIE